jgi:hypothetical protein
MSVCSQIHTKHINTKCEQKLELLNVKLLVNSDHWFVNRQKAVIKQLVKVVYGNNVC